MKPQLTSPDPDMFVKHRGFFLALREACLSVTNELEIHMGIFPTTSQIRRDYKLAMQGKKSLRSEETQNDLVSKKTT